MGMPFHDKNARAWKIKDKGTDGVWRPRVLFKGENTDENRAKAEAMVGSATGVNTGPPTVKPGATPHALEDYTRNTWLVQANLQGKTNTIKTRNNAIEGFLSFASSIGLRGLNDVGSEHIFSYVDAMRLKGRNGEKGNLDSTIKANLSFVQALFSFAIDRKHYKGTTNPVSPVRKSIKPVGTDSDRAYTEEERDALLAMLANEGTQELHDLQKIMLYSGLRISACLALRKGWVKDGIILVPKEHSKNGIPITVPLLPEVAEILERRPEIVFPNPPKISTVYERVKRLIRKHGLRDIRRYNHCCRSTFATICDERGVSPIIIMTSLGHTTMTTTEKYISKSKRRVVDAFKGVRL